MTRTHLDEVLDALRRSIDEHGYPNDFSARWLAEEQGCSLTVRQIQRVSRQWPAVTLSMDDSTRRHATYLNGTWSCEDPFNRRDT